MELGDSQSLRFYPSLGVSSRISGSVAMGEAALVESGAWKEDGDGPPCTPAEHTQLGSVQIPALSLRASELDCDQKRATEVEKGLRVEKGEWEERAEWGRGGQEKEEVQ
jgi:hypothetical protein